MDPDIFRKLLGNERWFRIVQVIGLDMDAFLSLPLQDEFCILEFLLKMPGYFGQIVKDRHPDGLMTRADISALAAWVRRQNQTDGAFRTTKPIVEKGQHILFDEGETRG